MIISYNDEYSEYKKDESRNIGYFKTISFPKNHNDVIFILKKLYPEKTKITIQGSRTGITAGAVPYGGHVINMSKMNKILSMRYENNNYYIKVQPGVLLFDINNFLKNKSIEQIYYSEKNFSLLNKFFADKPYIFPPDPTEPSCSIGGMVSCNASGACSYFYGPTRNYINSIKLALPDGDTLFIERNTIFVKKSKVEIYTDSGKIIKLTLPEIDYPKTKNAAGYYIKKDMDIIDLFIGSEGTLGIFTEIELKLIPAFDDTFGIMNFFKTEEDSLSFVNDIKNLSNTAKDSKITAIEFFNQSSLKLVQKMKHTLSSLSHIADLKNSWDSSIYVELSGTYESNFGLLENIISILEKYDFLEADSWVATNENDLEKLKNFRHAVPESINLLVDNIKKTINITKLSTDMAVPDKYLQFIMNLYNENLNKTTLDYYTFGHIGNNHIHVNIIPHSIEEQNFSKDLYNSWADKVVSLGGTISAEHGIGKSKTSFFEKMYTKQEMNYLKNIKKQFDNHNILNSGNIFEMI